MISLLEIAMIACAMLVAWWYHHLRGYRHMPPGPTPLPLLGTVLRYRHLKKRFKHSDCYKKDYGDIATTWIGPKPFVILNTADLVREAFLKEGLAFANRPDILVFRILFDGGEDIASAPYCPRLQVQRKVALSALRKYASGEALEKHLEDAFDTASKEMEKRESFDPRSMAYLITYNVIASMCFGKKFSADDPFLVKMMNEQKEFEDCIASPYAFLFSLPIFRWIPNRFVKVLGRTKRMYESYLDTTIKEHRDTYDPENISDFTYSVIHTLEETSNDPNERNQLKLLNEKHFRLILFDVFFAGTETTRQSLAWIWQYLAAFPEIQKKAQDEVDAVLGPEGRVTVDSREQFSYVNAVLHEVMRIRPVLPSGVPRSTTTDITLAGYTIPKGTTVMINTWGIHHDEREWENPEAFLPDRWLDEQGQYHFQQNGFVPFSVGRRSCIGESFAKLELLMLTVMTLQRYNFKPLPGMRISVDTIEGFRVRAKDQVIVAERRKI